MKIVLFCHSLLSDWNHGNAHFLRGVVSELIARGDDVRVYEPANAWSLQHLRAEHGEAPIDRFRAAYRALRSTGYDLTTLDLDAALDGADVVIVHEWNDHELVHRVGRHRAAGGRYSLLFHDTHHRGVTQPREMEQYDLAHYDAVLAFGGVLRDLYIKNRWTRRAWTWHEAADPSVFRPIDDQPREGDLIWIGNWGDEERTAELHEFLLEPAKTLRLRTRVHGVRYPDHAKHALSDAGIEYGGWLPNFDAPAAFARFGFTVHVPRRPYVRALPGIPTIRVFEALACGIPLICSPWDDAEQLFTPEKDYLVANDGKQMTDLMLALVHEPDFGRQFAAHGLRTILSRHTCAHRVKELTEIIAELRSEPRAGGAHPQAPSRSAEATAAGRH